MHKYIIMGPQGCGKGTQAKLLAADHDFTHISVGDIFRWHIQNHTKVGSRIKQLVAAGGLVPDTMVEEIVKVRLDQHDWHYGFILDGFPRNLFQAEFFLENYDVNAVILLDVSDSVVEERIQNRWLCRACGRDYNRLALGPGRRHAQRHPPAPRRLPRPDGAHPAIVPPPRPACRRGRQPAPCRGPAGDPQASGPGRRPQRLPPPGCRTGEWDAPQGMLVRGQI